MVTASSHYCTSREHTVQYLRYVQVPSRYVVQVEEAATMGVRDCVQTIEQEAGRQAGECQGGSAANQSVAVQRDPLMV